MSIKLLPKFRNDERLYEGKFSQLYETTYSWKQRYKIQFPFFQKLIKSRKIARILDVGCGNGFHLILFRDIFKTAEIVGIDKSKKMINSANKNLHEKSINDVKVTREDIRHLSERLKGGQFDLITCFYTLSALTSYQHVSDALKQLKKLLSKKGVLVIEDTNGERILEHRPTFEFRPMKIPLFTLLKRFHLTIELCENLPFPLKLFWRPDGRLNLRFSYQPLFNWLKNRNTYVKVYHLFGNQLSNDHIFIFHQLSGRINLELFKTNCLLLTKKRLNKSLMTAGFKQVNFFGDFNLSPLMNSSHGQIVIATP